MKRRQAIKILGSSAVMAALIAESAHGKKLALGLDKAEQLREVGGSALLKIRDREILFIRDTEETIQALNPTCTHKQCTVEYHKEKDLIVCPCHGSTYSPRGEVLKGPAPESLTSYEATLSEDRIIFELEE